MADSKDIQPLACDNVTRMVKDAGDEAPTAVSPGHPHDTGVVTGKVKKDACVGDEANSKQGMVYTWEDMEKIWHDTFNKELRLVPEEHPVLLDEGPVNPKASLGKKRK